MSISNDSVSTKIHDKRDDFDFEIVNFPFLDGDVSRSHPMESISLNSFSLLEYLVILQTSTLAINCKIKNFLNKAMGIINFAKPFQAGLKSLLCQGLLEPEFYGDLVYRLKKIVSSNNFQRSS